MGLGKKGKLMKTTFIKKSQTGKQVSGPRRPKPKASVNKEDRCRKTHGNRILFFKTKGLVRKIYQESSILAFEKCQNGALIKMSEEN